LWRDPCLPGRQTKRGCCARRFTLIGSVSENGFSDVLREETDDLETERGHRRGSGRDIVTDE